MIDGNQYLEKIKEYFFFLIDEHDFTIVEERINGNFFYDIRYSNKVKVISISYENIEDYFQVIIFTLTNGKLPNYDDKTKTFHLNDVNHSVFSKIDKRELAVNNDHFLPFKPVTEFDRMVLKSATDLRLFLNHFDEIDF